MTNIEKLPRWARNEIIRLRENAAQMERDMAMIVGATKTRVEVDPFRGYRGESVPRLYLPETFDIAFSVGEGRMHAKLERGLLQIRGHHPRGSRLAILPSHANCIDINFENGI